MRTKAWSGRRRQEARKLAEMLLEREGWRRSPAIAERMGWTSTGPMSRTVLCFNQMYAEDYGRCMIRIRGYIKLTQTAEEYLHAVVPEDKYLVTRTGKAHANDRTERTSHDKRMFGREVCTEAAFHFLEERKKGFDADPMTVMIQVMEAIQRLR